MCHFIQSFNFLAHTVLQTNNYQITEITEENVANFEKMFTFFPIVFIYLSDFFLR